jgi:hypothetical protein
MNREGVSKERVYVRASAIGYALFSNQQIQLFRPYI